MIECHEDLELPQDAAAALAEVIRRNVTLAVECLRDASIHEPVAAICLYGDDAESPALPDMIATRHADRVRRTPESWEDHWLPDEDEDVYIEVPALDDRAFARAEETVLGALDGQVLDPPRWVLLRVAHDLNRQPLPVPFAEDGLVHLLNHDPGDEFIEELRFVAPPGVFERLRERGLIGGPEPA